VCNGYTRHADRQLAMVRVHLDKSSMGTAWCITAVLSDCDLLNLRDHSIACLAQWCMYAARPSPPANSTCILHVTLCNHLSTQTAFICFVCLPSCFKRQFPCTIAQSIHLPAWIKSSLASHQCYRERYLQGSNDVIHEYTWTADRVMHAYKRGSKGGILHVSSVVLHACMF